VTDTAAADRRALRAPARTLARPGVLRRAGSALRAGLFRQLADDDARVAYWVRHVRNGVLLSELSAWAVVGYVLLTHTPGHNHPLILAMAGLVIIGCPGLFLLPLAEMMRDHRGPTMFYCWSIATTALVIIGTRLDGGAASPLDALLFLR